MENLSIDIATRVQWSSWSRCESSFSMLLVPHRPGIFALAEEVADGQQGKRILALFHVAEARDLSFDVVALFSSRGPIRERLEQGRCHLRYTMISDPENRKAVLDALQTWMASSGQQASGIFKPAAAGPTPQEPASRSGPPLTQSHKKLASYTDRPVFPAGF